MARKRYKTEREDYRAGGRVTLARGGRRPAKGKKKKKKVAKKTPTPIVRTTKPQPKPPAPKPPVRKPATRPAPKPQPKPPAPKPQPKPEPRPQPRPTQTGYGSEEADTGVPDLPSNPAQPMTNPTTATAYSEEPDLSSGTDGMVNMYGDTPAYGGPTGTTAGTPETTPEPPVTTPEPPGTTPEPPVTTPEPPVTTPEEETLSATEKVLEDSKIPDAVQAGYKRDSEGNFIIGEDGKPMLLDDDTATTIAEGTDANAGVAGPVTIDPTATGTVTTAEAQDPLSAETYQAAQVGKTSPSVLINQWADKYGGMPSTDMSTPKYNPETRMIEKFSESEGMVSWTPQEFATEFNLEGIQDVVGAKGTVTRGPIGDIQGTITGDVTFATVDELKIKAGKAKRIEDVIGPDDDYLVTEVEGEDTTVSATPDAEKQTRTLIIGTKADDGTAAQIIDTVGYTAAKQRIVKGKLAQGEAADMIAQVGNLPPDIAAAIVEDPAVMIAQVDENPVEVNAAIAALPTEALVSSQMESLLGGMEDGTIPAWAKPAVDAVNQGMAARGLSVSTVGRDALFNSIIQSAMPMAQSNAQALQARAAQNLSNEQQANLQQATQEQQLRLQNLSNRQGAASQTAQMAQQMKTMQSQFKQDAVMTSAQMQQQTRTQNLQNQQQAAVIQSQNEQQANMQNLSSEQQLNMAELQVEANAVGADQAAENQEKMAEMQVAADFLSKNAGFKQQMELANLSNDQQMRLANLSSRNLHESELLSNAEKTELANLNKTMQTNQLQAQIASQMGLAQLNVDQQSAIQNATTKANMDLTKFNDAQQVELANSKFMQTVALTDMNAEQQSIMQNATAMASMDIANLGTRERLAVTNAQNFLAMDMANLNNDQQATMMTAQQTQQRMLSNQAATNAARQFNSTSENQTNQFMTNLSAQMEQFNSVQSNAMEQFNVQQTNQQQAQQAGIDADLAKTNAALSTDINRFNAQIEFSRDNWNAQNEAVVKQSNVLWRRNANTINTAAANTIAMQNAQNAFGLGSAELSYMWQEARDKANYSFQSVEREADRKVSLLLKSITAEGEATVQAAAGRQSNTQLLFATAIRAMFGSPK